MESLIDCKRIKKITFFQKGEDGELFKYERHVKGVFLIDILDKNHIKIWMKNEDGYKYHFHFHGIPYIAIEEYEKPI